MKITIPLFMLVFIIGYCFACTYSITQVHTQGTASDVVDENQTPTSTVNPNINVPVSALPSVPKL